MSEEPSGVFNPEKDKNIDNLKIFLENHITFPDATIRIEKDVFSVDIDRVDKSGALFTLDGDRDAEEFLKLAKKAGGLNLEVNIGEVLDVSFRIIKGVNINNRNLLKALDID